MMIMPHLNDFTTHLHPDLRDKLTTPRLDLFDQWVSGFTYARMGEKTTVVLLKLKNGFEVVGTSACVDPTLFEAGTGFYWALVDALNKLNELAGFHRQEQAALSTGVEIRMDGLIGLSVEDERRIYNVVKRALQDCEAARRFL